MENEELTTSPTVVKTNMDTVPEVKVPKKFFEMIDKKLIVNVFIVNMLFVFIIGVTMLILVSILHYKSNSNIEEVENFVPQKTEYGKVLPPGFVPEIPSAGEISQSYSKMYQDQTQMSIVYYSKDVVDKNFAKYDSFLKDNAWKTLQRQEGVKLSILQAVKESYRLEVTIVDRSNASSSVKSHVIVNLFRK